MLILVIGYLEMREEGNDHISQAVLRGFLGSRLRLVN